MLDAKVVNQITEEGKNDPRYKEREEKRPSQTTHISDEGAYMNGSLSPNGHLKIDKKIDELDVEIEELKKKVEAKKIADEAKKAKEEKEKAELDEFQQLEEKYSELTIVLDKSQMGVVEFTDEERAKMEVAKVIKVHEVEDMSIKVAKAKRNTSNKSLKKLLEAKKAPYSAKVVLPISGYTAVMGPASAYELIDMYYATELKQKNDIALNKKWSIIYNKLLSTSIGKMSYDEFLHNTSFMDYECFIYGILAATYGLQDRVIPLNCNKTCNNVISIETNVKSLIRMERLSERMLELFTGAVDHSVGIDNAKEYRLANSPFMQVKNYEVDGVIITVRIQSVYDHIHYTAGQIEEYENDPAKTELAILACNIEKVYIPDGDDYVEFETLEEKIEVLYSLDQQSINIVNLKISELLEGLTMDFGILNAKCNKCGTVTKFVPFNIESLLFTMAVEAQNQKVE